MTKQQPDSQVSTAFPKTGEVHEIFPGLTYRPETEVDTITWSNRYIPRNNSLYLGFIIGLVIFTPLALFLTLRLIDDINRVQNNVPIPTADLVIAVFFVLVSWIGFAGLTYYLARLSWTETIKISNDDIVLQYAGLFAPKSKQFQGDRIWCLSFEKVGNERDQEGRFTLNLFDIDDRRESLAYWIRAEENYKLFLLLGHIFDRRGWAVQSRSTYQADQ